jgi:serine/threonine protein kinase
MHAARDKSVSEIPAKIGKYVIEGIAGKGAMGIVYFGHDPFVDRKVAVKLCTKLQEGLDDAAKAEMARDLFINEARAAGALDHPNILKIYEAGEDDQRRPYIVMEYIDGGDTLRLYTKGQRVADVDQCVEWLRQCAEALAYAHSRGVNHRDIKPANIMLTPDGVPKIVDFGIAQRTKSDQAQVSGWFGSPRYMSPEQARDEAVSSKSDQFSLGVVMYELLTGRSPFEAKGISGLLQNIIAEDPTPINKVRPELPTKLANIVARTMAKQPADRFPSCAELAAELRDVLEQMKSHTVELNETQKYRYLKRLSFFNGFTDSQIAEVIKVAIWKRYMDHEPIIKAGETDAAFFVVVEGNVTVAVDDREIAGLGAGECVGEMGYLSQGRRSASVTARSPSLLIRIEKPVKEWASLPCQLRINKRFQDVLISRLTSTSQALAKQTRT